MLVDDEPWGVPEIPNESINTCIHLEDKPVCPAHTTNPLLANPKIPVPGYFFSVKKKLRCAQNNAPGKRSLQPGLSQHKWEKDAEV